METTGLSDAILSEKTSYTPTKREKNLARLHEILVNKYVLKLLVYGKHNRYDFRTTSPIYVKRKESLNEVKKC